MFRMTSPLVRYRARRYAQLSRAAQVLEGGDFGLDALRKSGYYSQCGQDKWLVENAFPGVRSGVFVDIGAHDGVSFSNTFYFNIQG